MGTYIALAAPANLFVYTWERETYTNNTTRRRGPQVIAVYVPKEPNLADVSYYALSDSSMVKVTDVYTDVFTPENELDALDKLHDELMKIAIS